MEKSGLSQAAQDAFKLNYEQLVAGVTGLVRALRCAALAWLAGWGATRPTHPVELGNSRGHGAAHNCSAGVLLPGGSLALQQRVAWLLALPARRPLTAAAKVADRRSPGLSYLTPTHACL